MGAFVATAAYRKIREIRHAHGTPTPGSPPRPRPASSRHVPRGETLAVGGGPKGGFHVLRHTCASIMPEAGESVVTLARRLGHSSPAITLGYYAHFMPEAGSKGRGTIDGLPGERGDRLAGRNSPDSPQRRRLVIPSSAPQKPSVDCKAEEMGGLGNVGRGRSDPLCHAFA
ncbi:tyrosine-type recombinase/integrase [Streptomyces wedmorensis]|uniref:tyrosine-type recombinase/integrase n=1 Tax=Streptomyces wedmorensis TaxID=43759 RepID=UPI00342945D6